MLAGAAQGCCTGPETGEHAGKGCSGLLRMVPRECACSRGAAHDLRIDQIEQHAPASLPCKVSRRPGLLRCLLSQSSCILANLLPGRTGRSMQFMLKHRC